MSISIRDRRLELGFTLEEVGKAVGVGKSTVRKWETGSIENMGRDKIVALAQKLKLSPLDILDPESKIPDTVIDQINNAARKLNSDRQHKVLNYAQTQLDEQNGTSSVVNDGGYEEPELLAAHLENRNLNDEQQERVDDYIAKLLQEETKE